MFEIGIAARHQTLWDLFWGVRSSGGGYHISYTAHKKFMNSFGCHGYDPYSVIISTGHCQKTLAYKPAK